jgi:hypothetical protein
VPPDDRLWSAVDRSTAGLALRSGDLICINGMAIMTGCVPQEYREEAMRNLALIALLMSVMSSDAIAQNRPTRFWNLTGETISEFYLAPAGTTNWGINQTKNDKDGTVDPDERLRITDIRSGSYDAKFKDVKGKVCLVRNLKVEIGEIFSIEQRDIASCDPER